MTEHEPVAGDAPAWFQAVDFAAVAAQLNERLHSLLAESTLSGELGYTLAARMGVSKLDSRHDEGAEPYEQFESGDKELSAITARLSEELKAILREQYGAPEEDVAYAVVRRWDLLAGAGNECVWSSAWNNATDSWCTIKRCC